MIYNLFNEKFGFLNFIEYIWIIKKNTYEKPIYVFGSLWSNNDLMFQWWWKLERDSCWGTTRFSIRRYRPSVYGYCSSTLSGIVRWRNVDAIWVKQFDTRREPHTKPDNNQMKVRSTVTLIQVRILSWLPKKQVKRKRTVPWCIRWGAHCILDDLCFFFNQSGGGMVYAGEYDTNKSGLEITNTNFLAHGWICLI